MSEKTETGGPAFPTTDFTHAGQVIPGSEGMTLRDYFIAHAPAEPQPWFEPVMPKRPDILPFVSDDGKRFYDNAKAAEQNEGDCYSSQNAEAIREWDIEKKKQRFVQWPAAWADEMLKARSQ